MIETNRLRIYPASDEQMEKLIEAEPVPELKEAYTQMLDGCRMHPNARVWYAIWNIELSDGTLVGNLSFKGLDNGIAEIGYGTNSGFEGKGYMTEAVTAVAKWASRQAGVERIEAETEEGNAASKRVLAKAGFVPTGEMGEEGPRYVWVEK